MSYKKMIGGVEMEIGTYTSYIDQYEVRVKVFALEIVGLNREHKTKTDETYLAKLAMGLIYRLVEVGRTDLIETVIQSLFAAEYPLAGYKAKLYKYALQALADQGYVPEDPLKTKQEAHLP